MASYLCLIPPGLFTLLPATLLICYFWSVKDGHVYPVLPNISEIGAQPPESCLYGMLLNLIAFMMLFTVYIRHKEVVEVIRAKKILNTIASAGVINRMATVTGIVACISLNVVANFQESSGVVYIHQVANVLCFYSSAFYIIQQAVITSWTVPEISGPWIVYARWLLGTLAAIAVLSDSIFTSIAVTLFYTESTNNTFSFNATDWTPQVPGYYWHCFSSATQWLIVIIFGTFFLTFYWDFRKISIYAPELEITMEPIVEPVEPKLIHFCE